MGVFKITDEWDEEETFRLAVAYRPMREEAIRRFFREDEEGWL